MFIRIALHILYSRRNQTYWFSVAFRFRLHLQHSPPHLPLCKQEGDGAGEGFVVFASFDIITDTDWISADIIGVARILPKCGRARKPVPIIETRTSPIAIICPQRSHLSPVAKSQARLMSNLSEGVVAPLPKPPHKSKPLLDFSHTVYRARARPIIVGICDLRSFLFAFVTEARDDPS
jgi:hypothetical protein